MSKKILVVEDDRDILISITELLTMEGYEVLQANSGLAAINLLKELQDMPDLIILDLMMPGMNGEGFRTEQLKNEKFAAIPVLLMTADAHPDSVQLKIGAKGFIKKPLNIDKFLETIDICVN